LRAFRLCKARRAIHDAAGAELFGGRWNSKGIAVLYLSESRALSVLETLVHLSGEVPEKYVLGSAEFPERLAETVSGAALPLSWKTAIPAEQTFTKAVGDNWVRARTSAVLSVPSVIVGERNFLMNPAHPDYGSVVFSTPQPFELDTRLLAEGRRNWRTESQPIRS
jgi:RES domain-containing protein